MSNQLNVIRFNWLLRGLWDHRPSISYFTGAVPVLASAILSLIGYLLTSIIGSSSSPSALLLLRVQPTCHRDQSLGLYFLSVRLPYHPNSHKICSPSTTIRRWYSTLYNYLFPAIIHLNHMTLTTAFFLYAPGSLIMVCPWILKNKQMPFSLASPSPQIPFQYVQ